MRRAYLTFAAVAATALFVQPADAQLQLGVHGAFMVGADEIAISSVTTDPLTAQSGDFGVGGRLVIAPPLSPITGFASGTYYMTDAVDAVWTATLGAQLRVPLPMIKPYVAGGYQIRPEIESVSQNGFTLGGGVQLLSFFVEGMYEFGQALDPSDLAGLLDTSETNRFVIKAGLLFG